MINYNKTGQILNGDFKGWNIKIEEDTQNTGGYYVYMWQSEIPEQGYDDWYENEEVLMINLRDIEIDWGKE